MSVNPLKPSLLINSESSADLTSSNSQDNSKATPAKEKSSAPSVSSSSSATKNSNQNKETNENNPVWQYVALIIGICALACVLWFVLAGRKRKNK